MEQRNECFACGEILPSQEEARARGLQCYGHHCNGAPTAATVRRIIREEIAAALKKQADSAGEGS